MIQRLTIIDQAQKRIQDLSANVADLKTVFNDKRSRGAFGEVQLAALIKNMVPTQHVSLQHTLSNGTRVDCLLKLPQPTGHIAIDAKFPLETFQKIQAATNPSEIKALKQQFRQDISHHIEAIAAKYIIPGETSDGALMFLPAEAIFADIHSHHPGLIELAQRKRVWIVSPTTMMAVLTTASAVLKDVATREQVHLIQKHLLLLQQDFGRFQKRMNQLSKHIHQAQQDVDDVNVSAQKISQRFSKIEQVELNEADLA